MAVHDNLRDTLLLCREQLGAIDAHPIYVARVRIIWQIVKEACEQNPQHWQAALERAERIADMELAQAQN